MIVSAILYTRNGTPALVREIDELPTSPDNKPMTGERQLVHIIKEGKFIWRGTGKEKLTITLTLPPQENLRESLNWNEEAGKAVLTMTGQLPEDDELFPSLLLQEGWVPFTD